MHKFIKYFYDNKLAILRIAGIIIVVLVLIRLLNNFYQRQQSELQAQLQNEIDSRSNSTIDNSNYVISKKQTINKVSTNNIEETMKKFVNYCNNQQYENAYNMLTNDCKNKLFKTKDIFMQNYVKKVFDVEKTYTMQAWDKENESVTYLVHFMEDPLSTGKTGNFIEEYYTFIEQDDGNYKLNINNFIKTTNYENLITTQDNIQVKILSKDEFKEYAIYEFQVYNSTENTIMLNGNKYRKKIFLTDSDKVVYSTLNENDFEINKDLTLYSGNSKKFTVRFNKVYNTSVTVKKLVLNDIILNYDEYLENQDYYENRITMKVNL